MSAAIGRERDAEQQEEQTDLAAFKAAQVASSAVLCRIKRLLQKSISVQVRQLIVYIGIS